VESRPAVASIHQLKQEFDAGEYSLYVEPREKECNAAGQNVGSQFLEMLLSRLTRIDGCSSLELL
jgi:hypothetical protein